MNRQEIDYLSQSLANKYFVANVILRHIGNTNVNRRVQQGRGVQYVHKVPLIIDITTSAIILFWLILLLGVLLLSLLGLIMLVFNIS